MERHIGVELSKLSNLSLRCLEQRSSYQLLETVSGTNGWIIGYVAHQEELGQPVYQRDLEGRFGITRSTASKVVNLMVQKGLLMQAGVAEDRRLKQLQLTPKARELKQLMDEDRAWFEASLRHGFSGEELDTLFSLLDRLRENLKDMQEKEGMERNDQKAGCPYKAV